MRVHAEPRLLDAPLPGGAPGTTVEVELLEGGWMHVPRARHVRPGGPLEGLRSLGLTTPRSRWLKVPVPVFLIHHPDFGPFLVDTGFHASVSSKPAANLGRLTTWWLRPELEPGRHVATQLRERGIEPKSLKLVVLTHLHVDHTSGVAEFPNATFVLSEREWDAAVSSRRPLIEGYRSAVFDYAFDYRLVDYDGERVDSYGTFGRTYDLFDDGSVRLAFTPGHSLGHQSVICRLSERDLVITGDAIFELVQLEGAAGPPTPADDHQWRRSLQELKLFRREYPDAVIVPGHDPDHWQRLERRYA